MMILGDAALAQGKGKGGGLGVVVATVVALGIGFAADRVLLSEAETSSGSAQLGQQAPVGDGVDIADTAEPAAGPVAADVRKDDLVYASIVELPPITVSLLGPSRSRIRLTCVALLSKHDSDALSEEIAGAIATYLRTVSIDQLGTAAGFEYLRQDLEDLVKARTDQDNARLVITGLVAE